MLRLLLTPQTFTRQPLATIHGVVHLPEGLAFEVPLGKLMRELAVENAVLVLFVLLDLGDIAVEVLVEIFEHFVALAACVYQ